MKYTCPNCTHVEEIDAAKLQKMLNAENPQRALETQLVTKEPTLVFSKNPGGSGVRAHRPS